MSNRGEINYYFKKKCQNKIGLFLKLVLGIYETWKNCRKVKCKRSRNFQEENWLKTLTQQLHSSRARMSRQSATLATTTRSTQMLRLTTCTPGIRWLHHCTFMSEKQVRACCRFITHKGKACFYVHSHFWAYTGKPVTGCHKKRKSNQELDNCQIRIILGKDKGTIARRSKIRDPETWIQCAPCRKFFCELFVNWRDKLILKQWKLETGYEQSRREQALLHEDLADRERALRDSRVRSIQKSEELKRQLEFRLEEFFR